jgi:hypothetical protein
VLCSPAIKLVLEGEDWSPRRGAKAPDRHPESSLPALYGADTSAQMAGDFLPRIKDDRCLAAAVACTTGPGNVCHPGVELVLDCYYRSARARPVAVNGHSQRDFPSLYSSYAAMQVGGYFLP